MSNSSFPRRFIPGAPGRLQRRPASCHTKRLSPSPGPTLQDAKSVLSPTVTQGRRRGGSRTQVPSLCSDRSVTGLAALRLLPPGGGSARVGPAALLSGDPESGLPRLRLFSPQGKHCLFLIPKPAHLSMYVYACVHVHLLHSRVRLKAKCEYGVRLTLIADSVPPGLKGKPTRTAPAFGCRRMFTRDSFPSSHELRDGVEPAPFLSSRPGGPARAPGIRAGCAAGSDSYGPAAFPTAASRRHKGSRRLDTDKMKRTRAPCSSPASHAAAAAGPACHLLSATFPRPSPSSPW